MAVVQDQDRTLRDLLRIFDRRRKTIVWIAGLIFLLSLAACVLTTRRYTATSTIQLQKSSSDGLNLDSLMGAASGGSSDSLTINVDLQTQLNILRSQELALKVIKDLDLEKNKDFQGHFNPIGWALSLLSPGSNVPDPPRLDLAHSPGRRARVLGVFNKNLKVKVIGGTRLLEVDYSNTDPKVAAEVVNHLVQALIDYTFQTKFQATNEASIWLEGQLGDLRKQSEDLQSKVVDLQKETGLFGVGGSDLQGKPIIYSPTLDSLQQTTAQLSQAELNRILKGAVYEVVKTGNAEMISQLSGISTGNTSQSNLNSLALIQTLRAQESNLEAQIAQDSSAFGSAYPKLMDERASLKRVQQSLQEEIARTATRAKNDYEIAEKTEAGARAAYEEQRAAASKLNDKTIAYTIMAKEATQSQELYQDLLKRLKEAGILEGLHSSNITIVDRASAPARPSKPNVPIYLVIGFSMGLFMGCAGALLVDSIDNKVQGVEEIEAMRIPLLGIFPLIKLVVNPGHIAISEEPNSLFSESVRALRSVLLISRSKTPPQVILVTSGSPGEGKSTVSLNLAAALAQQGKRVLLLEADLRRPVLRLRMDLSTSDGLSTLLSDDDMTMDTIELPIQPNLFLMPAGPAPPFPTELLGSPRMNQLIAKWRKEYEFIVMDSPPILPVSDARQLEAIADTTVLVVRATRTSRVALSRCYEILLRHAKDSAVPSVGAVLNGMSIHSAGYYGYYGYYGYGNAIYYTPGDEN